MVRRPRRSHGAALCRSHRRVRTCSCGELVRRAGEHVDVAEEPYPHDGPNRTGSRPSPRPTQDRPCSTSVEVSISLPFGPRDVDGWIETRGRVPRIQRRRPRYVMAFYHPCVAELSSRSWPSWLDAWRTHFPLAQSCTPSNCNSHLADNRDDNRRNDGDMERGRRERWSACACLLKKHTPCLCVSVLLLLSLSVSDRLPVSDPLGVSDGLGVSDPVSESERERD